MSTPAWIEISLAIGVVVLAVVLAGFFMKSLRPKPTKTNLHSNMDRLLSALKQRGNQADVPFICSVLVEHWLGANRSPTTFGIDARTRLSDVRTLESALGISLPRVYVFSPEAVADVQRLSGSDRSESRPLFSERRFVRQYWCNGLWNFWGIPLVLLGVSLRFSSLQMSIPMTLVILAPLFAALIWWLIIICKADLALNIRDYVVTQLGSAITEPFDPYDCVVVVRRALRPRAFQSYYSEVRWEFSRGADFPLLFAEDFDPKGTAWSRVLNER
ncbi:MAG: hypothetical protein JNM86_02055 [Phycisphaerae bacterium]|nr:hypothetical protein [Phycisphaerae bacterium]